MKQKKKKVSERAREKKGYTYGKRVVYIPY